MAFSLKHLLVAGVVATLSSFADAHSALLANSKLLGKLNGGECFNCAVGSYPVPPSVPASAVDPADPADGIAAYIKSSGKTVKELWTEFHAGTPYGQIVEPEAIKSATCGRYDPTAVGEVPTGAKISYKKSNHNGPGEVWVDGKKTWYGDDFIQDGGSLTADEFKCDKASCQVTWYWLGKVRVKGQWNYYQLYVQCFQVKGSGSGGNNGGDADETPATTPAPAPAVTTEAPAPAPADDDNEAPGTVNPNPNASDSSLSSDEKKAAKKAEKERRKAEKAAKKAAKEAGKNKNLRSESGSTSAQPSTEDEY